MLGRIAIHLNHDSGCKRRLRAAIQLASDHKAELIGVYPGELAARYMHEDTVIPDEIYHVLRNQAAHERGEIQKLFTHETAAAGVTAHWRTPQGAPDEALAMHARYCDLLIMSKSDNRDTVAAIVPNLPESVVMAAGRPVLMIPAVGEVLPIGRRVLFCWDHRRESARAFMDASPILQSCSELVVLTVDPQPENLRKQDLRENDFADYCASLGYPKPREIFKESEGFGVGNIILNSATDHGSDLIIMGAYGHSRMRQWVMGGASRTLLSSMTVPILLSH
ncbi:MAG: universal stress protein [Pollutimonas bauzanensis]|uniref:Nucleotide-binding universal stress protein, UspA family n=1 Tax=Pollutimonas bauzanensis TaxID=658167 RepID=A0A1M5ZAC6_9BURK|nr:universal stress protein [Pollutimonas bauzanensis]SHI21088.1 Nucleotide-binding universal stress protein, UspA family [Pollutimonas bauzanensis]